MSSEMIPFSPTDDGEVVRRLPEVELLRGRVREEVSRVFVDDVPEYFWLVRASENHHPPDERGLGGTWLHTKRVFTAYTMLERSFRAMSAIDSFEANCARGAVLLHDAFKYGQHPEEKKESDDDEHQYADGILDHLPKHTQSDHDLWMATHIRGETELPEEVAHCVESHGGPNDWMSHAGPEPNDDKTLLVHMADMLASNSNHALPVYDPAPELQSMTGVRGGLYDEWFEETLEF